MSEVKEFDVGKSRGGVSKDGIEVNPILDPNGRVVGYSLKGPGMREPIIIEDEDSETIELAIRLVREGERDVSRK